MGTAKIVFSCLFCLVSIAFALDAPILIGEPNVAPRAAEGVSCGIALQKGEISSTGELSLFDGASEIPAQFEVLTRHDDGSPMWVLTSFLTDITKNAKKQVVVNKAPGSAMPASPITVGRHGSVVEINNGAIRFQMDTVNFSGIDSLYYNNVAYFGGKTGGLRLDNDKDSTRYWNGPVTHAGFVYVGPLRATYRVQGQFFKKTCGGLGYSFLVTTYAGSSKITVDATITNSINGTCGDIARIKRASVVFPALFTPAATTSYKYNHFATAQPEIKDFSATGMNVTLQEEWNGGIYGHKEMNVNANYMHHNIYYDSGTIGADVLVERVEGINEAKNQGYEDGPWYWMSDGLCKSSQIILSFGTSGKSSAQLQQEFTLNKSPLMARPDPAYLSETGLYGLYQHFGTLEDEINTWLKFGNDTSRVPKPGEPRNLEVFQSLMAGSEHYDMEEDPSEYYLFQWLRTGNSGILDKANGWRRYMKTNFTFHTTGFTYDGQQDLINKISSLSSRTVHYEADDPAYAKYQYDNMVDVFSMGGCHFSGWGLIDWYCLTGDIEARDAADDLAEMAWLHNWYLASLQPGGPQSPAGSYSQPYFTGKGYCVLDRGKTRPYKFLVHYVSKLKQEDALWKNREDIASRTILNLWNVDPRGFLFGLAATKSMGDLVNYFNPVQWPDSLKNYIQNRQITFTDKRLSDMGMTYEGHDYTDIAAIMQMPVNGTDTVRWIPKYDGTTCFAANLAYTPLAEYYRSSGNEDARDFIIGCGQLVANTPLVVDRCGFTQDNNLIDYPFPGHAETYEGTNDAYPDVMDPSGFTNFNAQHDKCITNGWSLVPGALGRHGGWYDEFVPWLMATAYRYCGSQAMLDKCMEVWNRSVKREYKSNNFAAPENIMVYSSVVDEKEQYLTGGLNFFYEAVHRTDTSAPQAVTDLDVIIAGDRPDSMYVTFTVPADLGGSLSEYQLKYDTVPIVDYQDFNYANDYNFPCGGVKKAPFWYARNISGEKSPNAPAGNLENFLVRKDFLNFSEADTFYFALCTRDNSNNLSPVSNNAKLWTSKIQVENSLTSAKLVTLTAVPNPFNPVTAIRYRIDGNGASLKIFDIRGKLVSDLSEKLNGAAVKGQRSGVVVWNGADMIGKSVGSGLFFVRLVSGDKVKLLKLSLIK